MMVARVREGRALVTVSVSEVSKLLRGAGPLLPHFHGFL